MKRMLSAVCLALFVASGCATTNVTSQPVEASRGKLVKPDRIIVHDFAVTSGDLPPEERGDYTEGSATADQLETGREMGALVAKRLIEELNDMGMHAVAASASDAPNLNDLVIVGHFESMDKGSAAARWVIGFGSGKAELRTVVAGYVQTKNGLRRVGGGTVDSAGGKGPGLFIPIIVTAATANPIGLAVAGAAKIEGQVSGRTTIEGAAKRTADAIAERMKERFKEEGWL